MFTKFFSSFLKIIDIWIFSIIFQRFNSIRHLIERNFEWCFDNYLFLYMWIYVSENRYRIDVFNYFDVNFVCTHSILRKYHLFYFVCSRSFVYSNTFFNNEQINNVHRVASFADYHHDVCRLFEKYLIIIVVMIYFQKFSIIEVKKRNFWCHFFVMKRFTQNSFISQRRIIT